MAVRGIYGNNISAFIIVYLVTCANFQKMNLSSILAKKKSKSQAPALPWLQSQECPDQHGWKLKTKPEGPINDFLAQMIYLCLLF